MIAGTLTYNTSMNTSGIQKGIGTIKNIVVGLGIDRILSAAWNTISQSMDGAISRLDTLNNFPRVMSNLGIDAESSQKAIDDLAKRIEGIPTTLDDAAMAVERFTSKNGDVQESVEIFDAVNNAILAGGAGADIQKSALEQLSQAYSKGKPDMMEWRTLQMAMPAQLKQVAQAMGMTADELGEGLRQGQISMDDFIDTMIKLNKEGVDGFQSFEAQAKNSTGGIKTAITNAKTAVTRGVADIVKSIDEGLKDAGLGGIGQIVANIGKGFETVLKFIGSKLKEVLPPIIEFLKNAINKVKEWLSDIDFKGIINNIKKVISIIKDVMIKALQPVFEFIKNKILPAIKKFLQFLSQKIDTKTWENFKKTLEDLAPIITGVLVGILAFKTVTKVISVIENVTEAFKKMKSVMSSTTGMIGGIIAVLMAAAAAAKAAANKFYEPIEEAEQRMKSHITGMGQAFNDYSDKIQNATSMMDAYGRQLFITAEEDQRIQDEMTQIQDSITAITSQAHAERRALSQEEIDKVDEYLRKLGELSGRYIEVSQQSGGAMVQQAEDQLGSFEGTYEEFADAAASHLKTITDYEEQTTQSIKENVTQRIAALNQEYEGRDRDAEYDKALADIRRFESEQTAIVQENVKKVRRITQEGLDERLDLLQKDLDDMNNLLNRREQIHKEAIEKSEKTDMNSLIKFAKYSDKYKDEIIKTNDDISKIMEDGAAERLGTWINNIAEFKAAGGELTDEQKRMAESVLDIFEKTNAGNTESTKEMYKKLKQIVKTDGNELVANAKDTTGQIEESFESMGEAGYKGGQNLMIGSEDGIDDRLATTKVKAMLAAQAIVASFQNGLKENSPSKATYQMAEYFLQGFENGIRDNQPDVFRQVDNLGQDIIDKMNNAVVVETGKINAKASISSNVNRMFTINASFDGNVELDNRKVGRIVAPEVSRAIKVGGL